MICGYWNSAESLRISIENVCTLQGHVSRTISDCSVCVTLNDRIRLFPLKIICKTKVNVIEIWVFVRSSWRIITSVRICTDQLTFFIRKINYFSMAIFSSCWFYLNKYDHDKLCKFYYLAAILARLLYHHIYNVKDHTVFL